MLVSKGAEFKIIASLIRRAYHYLTIWSRSCVLTFSIHINCIVSSSNTWEHVNGLVLCVLAPLWKWKMKLLIESLYQWRHQVYIASLTPRVPITMLKIFIYDLPIMYLDNDMSFHISINTREKLQFTYSGIHLQIA